MMRYCHWILLCAVAASSFGQVQAADPLSWIPADVNAVAKINVAEVYKTHLAEQEGWRKQAAESFIQQQSFVPPGTNQIVIGAELDLSMGLVANRKFSVVVPDAGNTLEKLADWLPAGVEKVSGKSIAQFGSDGYVADAGDGCWLVQSASRQSISRWLNSKPTPAGSQLPRYLRMAMTSKENKSQVLLAIDLQDNFSQQAILEELKATDWFKSDIVIESNSKILASIQGVTVGISVDKERSGFATIDFGQEAVALHPVIEKLVNAVIERSGMSTDDILGWKWDVKGTQIKGTGPVTPGGARRLLSILDPPSITHAVSPGATEAPPTAEERDAKVSLKYFKSVKVLLDDLRESITHNSGMNQSLYLERYARKIDDLPKLHVDSQLLDFTAKVSSSFRYQAQVERMGRINAGTQKLATYSSASSYVGPYGWYSAMPNPLNDSVLDARAQQSNKAVRFSEWKQIEDGLVVVRRAMTEKYQIEF